MPEISDAALQEIHDLITEINSNTNKLERDVRDLYNLIHVVKGDGIRLIEYRRD